eukprot:6186777-Pleurochrysis_carterae.AAC.5
MTMSCKPDNTATCSYVQLKTVMAVSVELCNNCFLELLQNAHTIFTTAFSGDGGIYLVVLHETA